MAAHGASSPLSTRRPARSIPPLPGPGGATLQCKDYPHPRPVLPPWEPYAVFFLDFKRIDFPSYPMNYLFCHNSLVRSAYSVYWCCAYG